jgi:hypothetical protein
MTTFISTSNHLPPIHTGRLVAFEHVVDDHLCRSAQAMINRSLIGAAVALDAQGRLLSRRLAERLRRAGQAVLTVEPDEGWRS